MTEKEVLCLARDHSLMREWLRGRWIYHRRNPDQCHQTGHTRAWIQIPRSVPLNLLRRGMLKPRDERETTRQTYLDLTFKGAEVLEKAGERTAPQRYLERPRP